MNSQMRAALPTIILAAIGLAISVYLTIVHYRQDLLACGIGGDCETVQTSKWATVGPIPLALLGVGMCAAVIGLAVVRIARPRLALPTTSLIFGLVLSGLMYEIYLTYLELFVIDAICPWCVAFATVLLLLTIVEGWRIWQLVEVEE